MGKTGSEISLAPTEVSQKDNPFFLVCFGFGGFVHFTDPFSSGLGFEGSGQ